MLEFVFQKQKNVPISGDRQEPRAARGIAGVKASEGGCSMRAGGREETAADACVGGCVGGAAAAGVCPGVCVGE